MSAVRSGGHGGEGAGGAPPEAGTRSGRFRSRRTCAACRCPRASERPRAGPRCVSSSCPRTAARRGLWTGNQVITYPLRDTHWNAATPGGGGWGGGGVSDLSHSSSRSSLRGRPWLRLGGDPPRLPEAFDNNRPARKRFKRQKHADGLQQSSLCRYSGQLICHRSSG